MGFWGQMLQYVAAATIFSVLGIAIMGGCYWLMTHFFPFLDRERDRAGSEHGPGHHYRVCADRHGDHHRLGHLRICPVVNTVAS